MRLVLLTLSHVLLEFTFHIFFFGNHILAENILKWIISCLYYKWLYISVKNVTVFRLNYNEFF